MLSKGEHQLPSSTLVVVPTTLHDADVREWSRTDFEEGFAEVLEAAVSLVYVGTKTMEVACQKTLLNYAEKIAAAQPAVPATPASDSFASFFSFGTPSPAAKKANASSDGILSFFSSPFEAGSAAAPVDEDPNIMGTPPLVQRCPATSFVSESHSRISGFWSSFGCAHHTQSFHTITRATCCS